MPLLMPTEADDDDGHGHALPPRWPPRLSPRLSPRFPPRFPQHLTRRTVLQASLGSLTAATLPWAATAAAQSPGARPTSEDALGPFFPTTLQADEDGDLTTVPGRTGQALGPRLYVSGRVLDRRGAPVAGAVIDLWQANAVGRYAHPNDDSSAPLDPAFQGYARLRTDAEGRYALKTIKPGEYGNRTPHIHFDLRGQRSRLVTQMYFEGERRNETDGLLKNSSPAGRATKIARWGSPGGTQEKDALVALWDVVLAFG